MDDCPNGLECKNYLKCEKANKCLAYMIVGGRSKRRPASERWLRRFVSWLDSKLDHYAEMPVSDFERKGDTILRFVTTTMFTAAAAIVAMIAAIQWIAS